MLMHNETIFHPNSTEFLNLLRCPNCSASLEKSTRGLRCKGCLKSFPISEGIAYFVPSEDYAVNFGFEWSKHSRTQLDREGYSRSEETFRRKTGLTPEQLRGKWVLDAGCGMGRFAEVASRWGAKVVAVDLSRAAEVAARNLADRDNVWVCRADLRDLPLAPSSFDFIYSIGVLHHTPNCEESFKRLLLYLKPRGIIAIWIYSAYGRDYRMSDVYRKWTTKLSPRFLYGLCAVGDVLYYLHKGLRYIPRMGRYLSRALFYLVPISLQPDRESRLLGTFDWYSPQFQSKHTYEEVFRWLEDCRLVDKCVLAEPIAVQARKPCEENEQVHGAKACPERGTSGDHGEPVQSYSVRCS